MLLYCQLKSLLKNYFKTVIVGFGKADVLGLSLKIDAYVFGLVVTFEGTLYLASFSCHHQKLNPKY